MVFVRGNGRGRAAVIGRAGELGEWIALSLQLERGRPATLEVVGEPGIGKSRLLAELVSLADRRGHLVLSGTASELERELPFWVFVDAIDDYLRGLEPAASTPSVTRPAAALAVVFPSFARFAVRGEGAVHYERYRSHRAVRELLERLTATEPLVLVLDDIHWADPASVELIRTLLRSPPDAAVLIAVALRPLQAPGRLSAALERAWRAGTLTRLDLGALTRVEAAELLDPTMDEQSQERCMTTAAATRSTWNNWPGHSTARPHPKRP